MQISGTAMLDLMAQCATLKFYKTLNLYEVSTFNFVPENLSRILLIEARLIEVLAWPLDLNILKFDIHDNKAFNPK
jgi:hypothetical protein